MRCDGEPSGVSDIVRGKRRLYEPLDLGSNCRNKDVGQCRKKGGLEGRAAKAFSRSRCGIDGNTDWVRPKAVWNLGQI